MKKTFIVSLLAVVSFLSACGTTASKNTEPSTQSTNTAKTSASEKNSSEETSSSTVSEASSSVQSDQNSQTQETVPSTQAPQISSETTAPASSTNTNQDYSIFTPDQAKALQMLLDNKPELNDPDITFAFFGMVGSDYLFKATSISIRQQGGSGTLGFYRVTPQGTATPTDSLGNPY
jgi:DNA mismatch repair ATPase MutL